ncbi:AAA family ATPase [Lonepinella sp. MS14435]|uniref:AAA family ATPase n=1 Tax=Lonepinella sp. MS14435 TaxID=3003618 RepID=UPI0036D88CE4
MTTQYQLQPSSLSLYSQKMILRYLLDSNAWRFFIEKKGWSDSDLAFALGMPEELDIEFSDEIAERQFKENSFKQLLIQRYQQIQQQQDDEEQWKMLDKNIAFLTDLLNLSDVEQAVLHLATHLELENELVLAMNLSRRRDLNLSECLDIMSKVLNVNKQALKGVVKKNAKLFSYGILERAHYCNEVKDFIRWEGMLDIHEFTYFEIDCNLLLSRCLQESAKPKLTFAQFEHISEFKQQLLDYLTPNIINKQRGMNILIHGKAGVGKTEFASLLAQQLGVTCYTLSPEDRDGDIIDGEQRLNNCRLAQRLLETAEQKAMIIFDEVEDVFYGGFFNPSVAQSHKAWVNQLLENNLTTMIWLSNNIQGIDPAFLRRFDFIFEMPDLPIKNKEKLILEKVGDKLSPAYVHHFAVQDAISPALIDKGFTIMNQLAAHQDKIDGKVAINWFNQTLQAQGYKKIEPLNQSAVHYSLDFIACTDNIHQISQGLQQHKRGRICCYGPAGTGKTAWAKWLAEQAALPLLQLNGSDLLDPYVGGTEQKIARAFNKAKENNMLLVLDEVDSFLFDRNGADRSWERSMVNEMLTQIEKFDGLLVVSTNLMDSLDPAVLRRFDLKLKFDYLTQTQVCELAKCQAENLGIVLNEQDFMRLAEIDYLTAGDFAAVARRHQFSPFENGETWVMALTKECELKPVVKGQVKMGF